MSYKLTGLKLEIPFLSGLPLSKETTIVRFVFSGNTLFSILEFIAVVSIGVKKLDTILMGLRGMVSIPTAFLVSISSRSFSTFQL